MEDLKEQLDATAAGHEEQFNIAVNAAFQRGFGRWFEDTWTSAKAAGALPRPFISSISVFINTVLMKKFVAGLPDNMPPEAKEVQITEAVRILKGYLDQIEASAIQELYQPKPEPRCPTCFGPLPCAEHPVTSKGKQTIILPKKKKFQH